MGSLLFKIIFVGFAGYLLGSANSSLIVGKFYGVDVRKHGSGNAGATNALRTLGKKAAFFSTIGDMLKGVIAAIIGSIVLKDNGIGVENFGVLVGGFFAILGHNWPLYFKFKGGKGVLTTLAVFLMMDWEIALLLLGIFIIIVSITKYISLGSIISAALLPIINLIVGKSYIYVLISAIMAILLIARHHANISRLLKGTESKLNLKNKKS